MRWMLPGVALVLALAFVSVSLTTASHSAASPFGLRASAINLNVTEPDPTGDVYRMWTSNGTHVTGTNGLWVMGSTPREVDLTRLSSADAGPNVNLALRVRSAIASRVNVSYEIRLYPRLDNGSRYLIDYSNGAATLREDVPGAMVVNLTGNSTIAPASTITFFVNKSWLGGASAITAWGIDATSKEILGNYTYVDVVWQHAGDPTSAPAYIQGHVVDAANNVSLSGVAVSAAPGGYTTTTDSSGFYSLPATTGNFTLTFSLGGYDVVSKNATVQYHTTKTVNAVMSKSPFGLNSPWLLVGLIVVAAATVGVVVLVRRFRRPAPPPPPPPET